MSDLKRLARYIRPYIRAMTAAAALLMAAAALNLAILWVIRSLVNGVLVQHDLTALNTIIGTLLVLFLVQGFLTMGHSYLTAYVGQRVVADLRLGLFRHLQGLSLSFFTKRRTGELLSRFTNDVGVIQNVATAIPLDLLKHLVTLVGGVAILVYMNWLLCLLILAVLPIIVLVARGFGGRLRGLSTVIQDGLADTTIVLEEVVSSIRIVKSFVRETYEQGRFRDRVEQTVGVALTRARVLAVFLPVITFLTMASAAGVLWYGGTQVIEGTITPGDMIAFLLYGGLLIGPFGSFARLFTQVKEAQGATQRVFEILDTQPKVADLPGAAPLPLITGRIVFHNVHFSYEPATPVLRGISFQVEPGQVVALIGPSGGGKTTLIHLLHRFYDPTEGWIEIDGQDLRQATLDSLYRQIGLVPQETVLFGGTVRENILYGRLEAPEDELVAAAQAANAHDFIRELPKGYDTVVGEKGVLLSAGQRQRLAIARAILKDARLLILDEATASLDNESEALIQEALQRLTAGRTTFVIAHRLTTIQTADRIFVIDRGQLVEEGTHETLLDRKGLYHHLYTLKLASLEA